MSFIEMNYGSGGGESSAKAWVGTYEEYLLAKDTIEDGTIINITDDGSSIPLDDTSTDENHVWSAKKIIEKISENRINDVLGGDAYNPTKAYAVGDMCIDNNALYEKIGTTESGFKPSEYPSKWKKVTLSSISKFEDITSSLSILTSNVKGLSAKKRGNVVTILIRFIPSHGLQLVSGIPKPDMEGYYVPVFNYTTDTIASGSVWVRYDGAIQYYGTDSSVEHLAIVSYTTN